MAEVQADRENQGGREDPPQVQDGGVQAGGCTEVGEEIVIGRYPRVIYRVDFIYCPLVQLEEGPVLNVTHGTAPCDCTKICGILSLIQHKCAYFVQQMLQW